ncbi:hypothetical protein CFP65_1409 [Kitasatospora sp. MMS16-BH015]|uniref:TRAFAC clade GTPase domain-containing protein n=1 Tax=Kitasatospora sp. MMS16-BH015 TaxID=2018025 RepID=UPI000CA3447F|nr:hypothetical protein [Kitasatospora sp. MMS16-BH015]AUG76308.1 hypothetical protein CFP65_1409 [Kitasatospora sp. MMS16-BH015]
MGELAGEALLFLGYLALLTLFVLFVAPVLALGQALRFAGTLLPAYARLVHSVLRRLDPQYQTRPLPLPEEEDQPAHRNYWFGPAQRDLRLIGEHGFRLYRQRAVDAFRAVNDRIEQSPARQRPFSVPVGLALHVGLLAGLAVGGAALLLLQLGQGALAGLAQTGARATAGVLRGLDLAALRLRGLQDGVLCPHCFERVPLPEHECAEPECRRRHSRLLPGRYGILRRRCACGQRLPTTLLGGRYRLPGYCTHAHCSRQLSTETGRLAEFALPLIGGRAAGKTLLMAAVLAQLQRPGPGGRTRGRFADQETEERYRLLREVLEISGHPRATPREIRRAHSVLLDHDSPPRLLHLFDTAGERFGNRADTDVLRYARAARTFLFVLDPLAVSTFTAGLHPSQRAQLDLGLASDMPPQQVFDQAVEAIRAMAVPLRRCRLAVAISKTDLLAPALGWRTDWARQQDSAVAAAWLEQELGQGNLVRAMRLTFGEVRFFFTAARLAEGGRAEDAGVHESVAPLVDWCLAGRQRRRLRAPARRASGPGTGPKVAFPGAQPLEEEPMSL